MLKIRGTIDRFEGDKAVIRADGQDLIIPAKALGAFAEGDTVVFTISNMEEDAKNSKEIAKELLSEVLKGE